MEPHKFRSQSLLMLVLLLLCGMAFIYNIIEVGNVNYVITGSVFKMLAKVKFEEEEVLKGYLIKTSGCTIPDLKYMDPSIQEFIFEEEPVLCNNGLPPLFDSNETSVFLLESSYQDYNVTDVDNLTCCFRPFRRLPPTDDSSDTDIVYNSECTKIRGNAATIKHNEFVRVDCTYEGAKIYKDFFHFVPLKKSLQEAKTGKKLNVLIIGLDSISRLNLYRQMPQLVHTLEKLDAIDLLAFNKVGDNTFPNLIPILTGLDENELEKECWENRTGYFDKCPFIWKNFKEASYATAFGEDSAWMGLFYYTRKGFFNKPTDYFYDHFDLETNRIIGNNHRLNVNQCYGSRSVHEIFIKYIRNFAKTMYENSKQYFAFFWGSSLSHDFLNKPKLGDKDYADLLSSLNSTGTLKDTAVIMLSDHGMRWGEIRSTYQGRMEERLPFVYILLPEWYKDQNWVAINNLRTNRKRLTTPFDLHETLKEFLRENLDVTNEIMNTVAANVSRGISLFSEIPSNRSCNDAGIETHWCTCQSSKVMDLDDRNILDAVNFTIDEHINKQLAGYADCAQLELDEILDGRQQFNTQVWSREGTHVVEDFSVTFKTKPGGGIFETTVRKVMTDEGDKLSITGTVSRINLYGSQSKCITDFHLKLYCYCK